MQSRNVPPPTKTWARVYTRVERYSNYSRGLQIRTNSTRTFRQKKKSNSTKPHPSLISSPIIKNTSILIPNSYNTARFRKQIFPTRIMLKKMWKQPSVTIPSNNLSINSLNIRSQLAKIPYLVYRTNSPLIEYLLRILYETLYIVQICPIAVRNENVKS